MLPRLLFWLVCTVALAMLGLLVVAPWLDSPSRLVRLFAEDAAVRRTVFASALGLLVTASVFFRRPPARDDGRRDRSRPPPPDAVGA